MFHSILITGGSSIQRLKKAQKLLNQTIKPEADTFIINPETSISIKQVRNLENFLSKRPIKNPNQVVFLKKAHLLTLPAQNALLKTLEEPPKNSLLILSAPNASNFLDTITSRCQIINLKPQSKIEASNLIKQKEIYNELTKSSLSKKINLIAQYAKTKIDALDFTQKQLFFVKSLVLKNPTRSNYLLLKKLNQTIKVLNANANPKLSLECLSLSYTNS